MVGQDLSDKRFQDFRGFTYLPCIPREEGVTRRDPSPVIRWQDHFYVWYSRTTQSRDGYTASVYYATSADGYTWTEQGEVLPKGAENSFEERAVFTPTILAAEGKYFLYYTAVSEPFVNEERGIQATPTAIGVAEADTPEGPWIRYSGNPILLPDTDSDRFDSLRVDDTCFLVRHGQYWMYYKGRRKGGSPAETQMGLAIADSPTGPFRRHTENPVLDSGHEVCVWPHGSGVAALVCNTGPQGNTLQYGEDGVHFQKVLSCEPPKAPGPFREDQFREGRGPGIHWGISMVADSTWPYLVRFDTNLKSPLG